MTKEAIVHRLMRHGNFVRFFHLVMEPDVCFFLVELAVGGELFDRIGELVGWL
jgi:hypothetical protein